MFNFLGEDISFMIYNKKLKTIFIDLWNFIDKTLF